MLKFENVRLVRMADGKTYKLIRDLGLVKGGKGLRCHEPIMTFQLKLRPIKIRLAQHEGQLRNFRCLSSAVAQASA